MDIDGEAGYRPVMDQSKLDSALDGDERRLEHDLVVPSFEEARSDLQQPARVAKLEQFCVVDIQFFLDRATAALKICSSHQLVPDIGIRRCSPELELGELVGPDYRDPVVKLGAKSVTNSLDAVRRFDERLGGDCPDPGSYTLMASLMPASSGSTRLGSISE